MNSKSQVSLIVIIGIIIVIAVGAYFALNHSASTENLGGQSGQSLDFSTVRTNIKVSIDNCLEVTTLKAIDSYGVDGSENNIGKYIDNNLVNCLDNFNNLRAYGYSVEYTSPSTSVKTSDDLLLIDLSFPLDISKDGQSIKISDFQYKFRTSTTLKTPTGIIRSDTVMFSEDKDFVLRTTSDTQVVDADGAPVEQISIKVLDKNFEMLNNGVVVGQVAYEGDPSGAQINPPLKVTIRLKKGDLPISYLPQELKIGWFDRVLGVWRTYTQLPFNEDDSYYYYTALVDHFTPMAVVSCGVDGKASNFSMRMYKAFLSPVQPLDEQTALAWKATTASGMEKSRYISITDLSNTHCMFLPDKSTVPTTGTMSVPSRYYYKSDLNPGINAPKPSSRLANVEKEPGFPTGTDDKAAIEKCKFMIRDWNLDDQKGAWNEHQNYDLSAYKFMDGTSEKTSTVSSSTVSIDGVTIIPTIDKLKENCYVKCSQLAQADLTAQFSLDKTELGSDTAVVDRFIKGDKTLPGETGTGDGINDRYSLKCSVDVSGTVTDATFNTPDKYTCIIPDADKNLDDPEASSAGFYASPRTYGFIDGEGSEDSLPGTMETYKPDEYVGGYGEFEFMLNQKGDSCIQSMTTELLNPMYTEGAGVDCDPVTNGVQETCGGDKIGTFSNTPIMINGDRKSCSQDDKCFWTLNYPNVGKYLGDAAKTLGTLRAGNNIVGVWVKNRGVSFDGDAYANAILRFSGTGVVGQEDCGTTIQDRIEYICGCNGICPAASAAEPLNCLARARGDGEQNVNRRTESICSINFANLAGIECKDTYSKPGDTAGGICGNCPAGVTDKARCKLCPGRVTSADDGCYCGDEPTPFKASDLNGAENAFCCDGKIIPADANLTGCWQMSPLFLKPTAPAPDYGDCWLKGSECGDTCDDPMIEVEHFNFQCNGNSKGPKCCAPKTDNVCLGYSSLAPSTNYICSIQTIVSDSTASAGTACDWNTWCPSTGCVVYDIRSDEASCKATPLSGQGGTVGATIGSPCASGKGTCKKSASSASFDCDLSTELLAVGANGLVIEPSSEDCAQGSCCIPKDTTLCFADDQHLDVGVPTYQFAYDTFANAELTVPMSGTHYGILPAANSVAECAAAVKPAGTCASGLGLCKASCAATDYSDQFQIEPANTCTGSLSKCCIDSTLHPQLCFALKTDANAKEWRSSAELLTRSPPITTATYKIMSALDTEAKCLNGVGTGTGDCANTWGHCRTAADAIDYPYDISDPGTCPSTKKCYISTTEHPAVCFEKTADHSTLWREFSKVADDPKITVSDFKIKSSLKTSDTCIGVGNACKAFGYDGLIKATCDATTEYPFNIQDNPTSANKCCVLKAGVDITKIGACCVNTAATPCTAVYQSGTMLPPGSAITSLCSVGTPYYIEKKTEADCSPQTFCPNVVEKGCCFTSSDMFKKCSSPGTITDLSDTQISMVPESTCTGDSFFIKAQNNICTAASIKDVCNGGTVGACMMTWINTAGSSRTFCLKMTQTACIGFQPKWDAPQGISKDWKKDTSGCFDTTKYQDITGFCPGTIDGKVNPGYSKDALFPVGITVCGNPDTGQGNKLYWCQQSFDWDKSTLFDVGCLDSCIYDTGDPSNGHARCTTEAGVDWCQGNYGLGDDPDQPTNYIFSTGSTVCDKDPRQWVERCNQFDKKYEVIQKNCAECITKCDKIQAIINVGGKPELVVKEKQGTEKLSAIPTEDALISQAGTMGGKIIQIYHSGCEAVCATS